MIDCGIALAGCRHITATGNVVRNTTGGPGFVVENCAAGVIAANSISQSAEEGMRVTGCHDLVISGNVIDSYGQSKQGRGPWHGLRVDNCQGCREQANIVLSQ